MRNSLLIKGKGVSKKIKSSVIQSPLAGVTDKIFRKFIRRWAPESLLFTEMINATSLNLGYGVEKINQISEEEGPVGIQLFDNRPNAVADAAKESESSGAFIIDINMGCPVKKIAKKGSFRRALPPPFLAIFFTGQPIFISIMNAPEDSDSLAASATAFGLLSNS